MQKEKCLARSAPEAQGISSGAIRVFVQAAEKIHDLHSFMLVRHGVVAAEGWWYPYRADRPHMLFSLSKSFTSTAVGLAIAEGRLSLDDPLLKFFPQEAPRRVSPNLAAMHVRHLLSMSTGHDKDTSDRVFNKRNPIKAFLALPVEHAPGTHFVYNTPATFMLAAVVQKLTGQTLLEYLTPRLFEPLGIEGARWESHPNGVNFGGFGLNVKTEDIARFGQLYLQKGLWEGRRLIPAEWVRCATSKQIDNAPHPSADWAQGYGYQFWRCQHNAYRGDGAFGQYCIVMPEQDAVLAITGGLPDMQAVLTAVWENLLPAMQPAALPADPAGAAQLAQTLQALRLNPPSQGSLSAGAKRFSGQTYVFDKNQETLHSLCFDFQERTLTYRLLGGGARRGAHTLHFGDGAWVDDCASLNVLAPAPVVASGAWADDDTFVLTICYNETPFIVTMTCRFEAERLTIERKRNVGFVPDELETLVGMAK